MNRNYWVRCLVDFPAHVNHNRACRIKLSTTRYWHYANRSSGAMVRVWRKPKAFCACVCAFRDDPPTCTDNIRPGIPGYPPTPYWPVLHCCEALVMRGTLSFFLNDGTPYEESADAEDTRGLTASCERYVDEGIGFQFICGSHNLAGISEPCGSGWSGLAASCRPQRQ